MSNYNADTRELILILENEESFYDDLKNIRNENEIKGLINDFMDSLRECALSGNETALDTLISIGRDYNINHASSYFEDVWNEERNIADSLEG